MLEAPIIRETDSRKHLAPRINCSGAMVAQVSQKVGVQVRRSDTPVAGHGEPRGLPTQSSQRTSWKGLLPCLLPSPVLAYLGILHAHACCSHIARDQDGPVELPPDCPSPVRAIGAPESPLCFQKQKISFTINILLRRLINSSRSLRGTGQWLRGQSSRHSCSGRGRPLGFLRTAVVSCVPPVCL